MSSDTTAWAAQSGTASRSSRQLRVMLLLLALEAQGYHLGEDATMCWATPPGSENPLSEDCNGTSVDFVEWPAPGSMSIRTYYDVHFRVNVPRTRAVVLHYDDGGFDVAHANIHSCLQSVGYCSPFVANQPGLSTHSPQARCQLGEDGACTVTTVVYLTEVSTYTAIAHARWFDALGVKHDLARAKLGVLVGEKPLTTQELEARLARCHHSLEGSAEATSRPASIVTTNATLVALAAVGVFQTWYDADRQHSGRLISSITLRYTKQT